MADKTTPAFPVHEHYLETGLSIRDYFAAKAMQGAISDSAGCHNAQDPIHTATWAYAMADAMLRAREV